MPSPRTQINIRLNATELAKVKYSADVLGLSVGRYAKQEILHAKLIKPKLSASMTQEVNRQLIGIANNLNQLAKIANTHGVIEVQAIQSLTKEVNQLWQRLEK